MSRNYYDACHKECPANNGGQVSFQVLIGDLPLCPKCGQIVLENKLTGINGENGGGKFPLESIIPANSVERR